MTIFERLREDHDKHRTLIGLVAKTHGDSEGRREMFERLRADMDAHAAAEERCFYSRLLEAGLTQEKGRHSVAEHKQLDDLLEKLAKMDYSNPQWLATFRKFEELALHHMDEEEHEVFQLAGKTLSEAEKLELVEEFDALKQEEAA
ncbi:MAG: hemerythrin domain-containing protein [Gammaproteobacteria bacterium]|nr:hemerythrin domain-containing protein [Gammaproteobacteria bacterium]